jgi:hypothetical protein
MQDKRNCDYYAPIKDDKQNCPNCKHWGGEKCKIEKQVLGGATMQVTCSDSECKFCEAGICIADAIDHTSDRFCTAGRRRPRDNTAELMQQSEPCGYKLKGKWVSN